MKNGALQILGFGHGEENGMVFGLGTEFQEAERALGFAGGFAEHLEEKIAIHMVRAGGRGQDAAALKRFHGESIKLFVGFERDDQILL